MPPSARALTGGPDIRVPIRLRKRPGLRLWPHGGPGGERRAMVSGRRTAQRMGAGQGWGVRTQAALGAALAAA